MLTYAGVGSRKTPLDVLGMMSLAGRQLSEMGWMLRSGGALGADSAFASGTLKREVHLPWNGYNRFYVSKHPGAIVPDITPEIEAIARDHHPAWNTMTDMVRRFMYRNVTIILGQHLNDYANMVMCWTPNGYVTGGTGHGLRVAKTFNIPVFNLAIEADVERVGSFANDLSSR
jgi:hypothetical protein